jgi:hypothetical protein
VRCVYDTGMQDFLWTGDDTSCHQMYGCCEMFVVSL